MSVNDKNFYEALIYISKNQDLSRELFDHYLCTLNARIFIAILLYQEKVDDALRCLDYLRDLAEETYNYQILMETYLTIGKIF